MKRWLIISSIVSLLVSGCSLWTPPLDEQIVGTWVNEEGYEVEFYPNGQGFIPGLEGDFPIPDAPFSWRIEGGPKLYLTLSDGTTLELELTIQDDRMIWASQIAGFDFEYTRVK
jgi:hypothetical protein